MCPPQTVQIMNGVIIFLFGILLSIRYHYISLTVGSGITLWGPLIVCLISLFCFIESIFIAYFFNSYLTFPLVLSQYISADVCLLLEKIHFIPVSFVLLKHFNSAFVRFFMIYAPWVIPDSCFPAQAGYIFICHVLSFYEWLWKWWFYLLSEKTCCAASGPGRLAKIDGTKNSGSTRKS